MFVQVRPTADAFWPSPLEPWSQYLTGVQGQDPGYDPLAFIVDEAHRRNLELHAWFNPYRVSMQADPCEARARAPGAACTPSGSAAVRRQALLRPRACPRRRSYVQDAILDAVEHYDIDGVHFDDYFYPYPVGRADDFRDAATFAAHGAGFADIADWRRHNVDLLVRASVRAHQGR